MATVLIQQSTPTLSARPQNLGPCKAMALAVVMSSLLWAGILKAVVSLV